MVELLEELAELEHEQWLDWSKTIATRLWNEGYTTAANAYAKRWEPCWKPYAELTEEQKEQDRIWARKVMAKQAAWAGELAQLGREMRYAELQIAIERVAGGRG